MSCSSWIVFLSTGFQRHNTATPMTKSMGTYTLTVETMMSWISFSCVDFVNLCLLVYLNFSLKEVSTAEAFSSMQSCSLENKKCMQRYHIALHESSMSVWL